MAIDPVDPTVATPEPTTASGQETVATPAPATASGQETVATPEPTTASRQQTVRTESRYSVAPGPGGSEMTRRIVMLLFGLVQLVIGLRFVLLLLDAREANGIVSGILNLSQLFVAPFEGILRTDALHSAGSTFDIAAIVALVGWTIIELVVIWAVGIFRRQPA